MDYSLAEQLLLALTELAIDAHHLSRERPRPFWAAWTIAFAALAVLLLKPGRRRAPD